MVHFFIYLQDFVNLRIHRNSLGIHLNNLLRKDSDDECDGNESNSNGDYKKGASHSNELSNSSKIGLNQLMVKYLSKWRKDKKSCRKLVVTFDLHSISKPKIKNTQNGATTSDDAESDDSDSTDESPGIESDGKLNIAFRCMKHLVYTIANKHTAYDFYYSNRLR